MSGNIKRHSNSPSPELNITENGSALDLTGAVVKFIMSINATLAQGGTLDASETALTVTNSNANGDAIGDIIEVGDILMIDHEALIVTTALPTTPFGATVTINVTGRGYTIPATAASLRGSTLVSGDGDTVYELSCTSYNVNTITNTAGNTWRYTMSGSPDLSGLIVGGIITVANSTNAANDGEFAITAVSNASDYIEVTNAAGVEELTDSPSTVIANASFFLSIDGGANVAVTVKESDTLGDLTMTQLVAAVNTALTDASINTDVVATATGNRLILSTVDLGTTASLQLSSPNTEATNQLGLVAAIDVGEATVATAAASHADGSTIKILKIANGTGRVGSAAAGNCVYDWMPGNTDKAGTFYCEWEVTLNGRTMTLPTEDPSTYVITITEDSNDRKIAEGE